MKRVGAIVIALAMLLYLSHCDTNMSSDKAMVTVKMRATSGASGIEGRLGAVDSIVFTRAIVGVTKLEFEREDVNDGSHEGDDDDNSGPGDGDDDGDHDDDDDNSGPGGRNDDGDHDDEGDEDELEFEGEFVVDLIRGTSVPDFGIDQVIPGVYEEIEAEFSPILEDGNTVFIQATIFTDDGLQYTIEYTNNFNFELEIENDDGIEITGGLNSLLVLVNLDELFAGVDFGMAEVDTDGVIRVNANSNPTIAAIIASNFDHSVKCGEDRDGDHEIDDND